jgi:hypothetical protein
MARSSPEKLAAALRANLKRRKRTPAAKSPEPAASETAKPTQKPPKTPSKSRD